MLQPHQQRVLDEQTELLLKISKLGIFLVSDKFKTVSETEQKLLPQQLEAMSKYSSILAERIKAFLTS